MTTDHPAEPDQQPVDQPVLPVLPVLRIVSGNPTDAELAAVTALLLSLPATDSGAERSNRPTGWSDLSLRLRRPLPAGPDAWRNSRWQ